MTSCSIPTFSNSSMLDSTPDDALLDASSDEASEPDLQTEETEDPYYDQLIVQADAYMQVLQLGALQKTSSKFNISEDDLLPSTYPCDEEIYRVLFTHMTYYYGSMTQTNHQDYDLTVTCLIPDLQTCVKEVREDEEFMVTISEEYVIALISNDQDLAYDAYQTMNNAVLEEAIRRIDEEVFTNAIMYTDYFRFHDNIESWNCTRIPSFVTMLSHDQYMKNLGNAYGAGLIELIRATGTKLVEEKKMSQKALDDKLSELTMMYEEVDESSQEEG